MSEWTDIFDDENNYKLSINGIEEIGLSSELIEQIQCQAIFLIRTSGSSGEPKWVVHSKRNILEHARMVNKHLGIEQNDVLGLMLPSYHVGGLGVIARAIAAKTSLVIFDGKWSVLDGLSFLVENKVTVISLVPTQLVDLVRESIQCPKALRVVVIGGGKLDGKLRKRAVQLGWPIYESYGMTETGSQIATGELDRGYIKLIDGWEVNTGENGFLKIRGKCLMEGYLLEDDGNFIFVDSKEGGWFETSDRVDIRVSDKGIGLSFVGRGDQQIKILGELIDVSVLEGKLAESINEEVYLIAVNDERRGAKLVPVATSQRVASMVDQVAWGGLEKLERSVVIQELPFNEMGKLQRRKLVEKVESIVFPAD